jgi:hypothetical protein
MVISNNEVVRVIAEIPPGHRHLRTTVVLVDGTEMVFQEATIANIVRAYIGVKTHPKTRRIELTGKLLEERKDGYAEWQLLEEEKGSGPETAEAGSND